MVKMTAKQFADCVQKLMKTGRERYLSDDAMLAQLEDIVAALKKADS